MKLVKYQSLCAIALTAIAAATLPSDSSAKRVGGAALGDALYACLLADDSRTAADRTRFACCSKEAGLCVVCPQPPRAGNVCEVIPHRESPLPGARLLSPNEVNALRQQMQLPPRGTKPPNAATPAAPGVLPNAK